MTWRSHETLGTGERRHRARVCLVVWVFACLVAPALHLARHGDDHTHLPGGGVVHQGERADPWHLRALVTHGPQAHTHADAEGHGDGDLAHLAAALLAPPPALLPLFAPPAREGARPPPPADAPSPPRREGWSARGPPA